MNAQKFRTIRLLTTRAACCPAEFSLAHRRVYSYLAYRSRLNLADSQREIARQTKTDPRTTKSVLAFLAERKLVEQQNNKWIAQEPTGEFRSWFAKNKEPKYDRHWSDHFNYSTFLVPQTGARVKRDGHKRFTTNHAHVYSILVSLGRSNKRKPGIVERIGISRLSKMLNGLSPKTIRSSLTVLESIGLVVCYQEGIYETIHACPISDAHAHLFEAARPKQKPDKAQQQEAPKEVLFRNEEMQLIYKDCRREGFAIDLAKEITVAAAMAGIDSMAFDGYSELAAIDHAKNRLAGKVTVSHHGHLLKYKLEKVREEQDRIEERVMASAAEAKPKEQPSPTPAKETVEPRRRSKNPAVLEPSDDICRKIGHELVHTKGWLRLKLGRPATAADIVAATQDGRMKAWCIEGRISPFFLFVSPQVREAVGGRPLHEVFGPRCKCDYGSSIIAVIQVKYDDIFGDLEAAEDAPVAADPLEADVDVIEGMTQRQFAEALAGL